MYRMSYAETKWSAFMRRTDETGWKKSEVTYPDRKSALSAANGLRQHLKRQKRSSLYRVSQKGNMVTLYPAI